MLPVILIVDDDADTRSMLTDFISAEGYRPAAVVSGDEALALLASLRPDLVLLDAVMPGLNGFETCRQIKQIDTAAHVPVIFMTGLSDTSHVVMGLGAGGVDYVTKPLLLDELAARIRVHLGNALTTRGAFSALGTAGSRLVSADRSGRIGWMTPEAQRLVDVLDMTEAEALRALLRNHAESALPDGADAALTLGGASYLVAALGPAGTDELMFRLIRTSAGMETELLQRACGLTPREAHVLLWTSRGKSNKDMSEILNISARTVNKHLEQIFIKIGVENRASAASVATRILVQG